MDLISLKWFIVEKVVNFGYLIKFIIDCLIAWIEQLNYWLTYTRQGQIAMLLFIIVAVLISWKTDEKN